MNTYLVKGLTEICIKNIYLNSLIQTIQQKFSKVYKASFNRTSPKKIILLRNNLGLYIMVLMGYIKELNNFAKIKILLINL